MARDELSFIRNNSFSYWHRTQLPTKWYMTDIDSIIWKIDKGVMPLAVFEEKSSSISELDLDGFQCQAIRNTIREDIPFFALIRHDNGKYQTFYIVAANQAAFSFLMNTIKTDRTYLSEIDFIKMESYLRKEPPPLMQIANACSLKDKFLLPNIKGSIHDLGREASSF